MNGVRCFSDVPGFVTRRDGGTTNPSSVTGPQVADANLRSVAKPKPNEILQQLDLPLSASHEKARPKNDRALENVLVRGFVGR